MGIAERKAGAPAWGEQRKFLTAGNAMMRIGNFSLLIFICGVLIGCANSSGEFLLINRSGSEIEQVSILVCKKQFVFKYLKPNESVSGSYPIDADGGIVVEVRFNSGDVLQKELGYVTHGMDFFHELAVTDSDIVISGVKATTGIGTTRQN